MQERLDKDDEFRKEYEAIQPEMDVIRAIVDARTSQNMTQKELAERTGINQADISKLENGTRHSTNNVVRMQYLWGMKDFLIDDLQLDTLSIDGVYYQLIVMLF